MIRRPRPLRQNFNMVVSAAWEATSGRASWAAWWRMNGAKEPAGDFFAQGRMASGMCELPQIGPNHALLAAVAHGLKAWGDTDPERYVTVFVQVDIPQVVDWLQHREPMTSDGLLSWERIREVQWHHPCMLETQLHGPERRAAYGLVMTRCSAEARRRMRLDRSTRIRKTA